MKLILGTHNTQALGRQDHLLEEAYQKAYKPFLTAVYNFPDLALTLHYSGPLLSWLEKRHPEFITVLREMVDRKQVELLGGGFYEPILPLIPATDRVGQVEMMTTYLRKSFGRRSRGLWLSDGIWENQLAYTLKNCGMEFTFLDERRFSSAGVQEQDLLHPLLTEDQGKTIQVFPLCHRIEEKAFKVSPDELINEMIEISQKASEDSVLSLILPGESLNSGGGVESCDVDYLEKFLQKVLENKDILKPILPGREAREPGAMARRYFPTSSYHQLVEWKGKTSEKPNDTPYSYRHFLTNYRESNLLYSKMMYTQILVNQVRGDKSRKKTARDELWKGQNKSPYWHGRDRGIYDIQLRHQAYRFLIEAEKNTREKGIFIPALISTDFDMDGQKEFLYQGYTLNAYSHLQGGVLFELDYLPSSWNYLNTFNPSLENEEGQKSTIRESAFRKAFHDHFFDSPNMDDFKKASGSCEKGDFVEAYYSVLVHNRESSVLTLFRNGSFEVEGRKRPVRVQKRYTFKRNSIEVCYEVKNIGYEAFTTSFGTEVNLALPSPEVAEARLNYLNNEDEFQDMELESEIKKDVKLFQVQDTMNNTTLQSEYSLVPDKFWTFPRSIDYTSPLSGETKGMYQSTMTMAIWDISLFPGESWSVNINLKVGKSRGKAFA